MSSPIKRRTQARGISPQLAEYISTAGRDIVNEQVMKEVGGVGAALGAAFESATENKEKALKDQENFEKQSEQFSVGATDFFKSATNFDDFGKGVLEEETGEKTDYAKLFSGMAVTGITPIKRKKDTDSNFTPGRTFVEKEQTLSAPSFLASGALAGYNETVERRNYKKQVEADYQDYLNQEFSAFETDATGYNTIDVSLQDSMKTAQLEMYDLLQTPVGDRDLNWNLRYNQLRDSAKQSNAAGKNLVKYIKQIKEEEPDLDFNAMKPEDRDVYHSLISSSTGSGGVGFSWARGALSLLGSTNRNQPFKVSVKDLAAGKLPIKFYRAQDPDADIQDFMKEAEKITRTYERDNLGTTTVAVAEAKVREAAKAKYAAVIEDEDTLRGYASKELGYDYDAFNEARKRKLDIKDLVINKMADKTIDGMAMYFQQRGMTKGNKPTGAGGKVEDYTDLNKKFSNPNFLNSFNNPDGLDPGALSMVIGGPAIIDENDDNFIIVKNPRNNRELKINRKNREETLRILAKEVYDVNLSDLTITETKASGQGPRSAQEIYDQYKKSKK